MTITQHDKSQERWNNGYYSALKGATIVKFLRTEEDEFGGRGFPTFLVQLANGELIELVVSQDEEGNGGGFLFGLPDYTLPEFRKG
jgi:hypothetical protein